MREILIRELRAASRRAASHWARVAAAAIAMAYLYLLAAARAEKDGRRLFYQLAGVATLLCVLEGARRAAACIAQEKQEGTFPLLVLTKLTGREFVFGKFLAQLFSSLQLLIAFAPVFAIPILLGGVSAGDFVRSLIALLHFLCLSLALAVCSSAILPTALGATMLTITASFFGAIFFAVLAGFTYRIPVFLACNPFAPLAWVIEPKRSYSDEIVIPSIIIFQTLAVVALARAGKNLRADYRAEQMHSARYSQTFIHLTDSRGPSWFKGDPIYWLILRDCGLHGNRLGLMAIIVFVATAWLLLPEFGVRMGFFFAWMMIFFFALGAPLPLARARREGALELLQTTPLAKGLRKGYAFGLLKMVAWPAAILLIALFLAIARWPFGRDAHLKHFFVIVMALLVTPPVAIWAGLSARTPTRAVLRSLCLMMLLPTLLAFTQPYYFPVLGIAAVAIVMTKPALSRSET